MFLNPIFCFITIVSSVQLSPVFLNVEDDIIIFGSTIHLLCTLDDKLDLTNGRSRQWSGGSKNKVLSFNGFPSDPNKYKEDVISTRQFRLKIFNTSKADVNCFYKCVYGFKFDEKMLDLNTTKYQYIPAADEINTEISYSQEDKHISAGLTFQNIYPLPECTLSIGGSKLNMSVSRKALHGLFYQLSMSINCTWGNNCGTETKIECIIGKTKLPIWKTKPEQCLEIPRVKTTTYEMTPETTRSVDKAMVISVVSVLIVCCVAFFVLTVFWLRKRRAGNGETQNSQEVCELVAQPIVAVGEWEQKEKPMEQIGLWGTKPPKGTNGIHNRHNERLENGILL